MGSSIQERVINKDILSTKSLPIPLFHRIHHLKTCLVLLIQVSSDYDLSSDYESDDSVQDKRRKISSGKKKI